MMKKIIYIIVLSLLTTSCEHTLENEEFPFERKIILSGLLNADQPIRNIFVDISYPIGLDPDNSFLSQNDFYVAILHDDNLYRLKQVADNLFSNISITPEPGEKYQIIVQNAGQSVYAETKLPEMGEVISMSKEKKKVQDRLEYYMKVDVRSYNDECYLATWTWFSSGGVVVQEAQTFGTVAVPDNPGDIVTIKTSSIPEGIAENSNNSFGIRLYSYDPDFAQYYKTYSAGQTPNAIFGRPVPGVKWNVTGDGIGMFVGRSSKIFR